MIWAGLAWASIPADELRAGGERGYGGAAAKADADRGARHA